MQKLEVAHVAIHCLDVTGKEGCFLFSDEHMKVAASPTFPSLVALYAWSRINGWRHPANDEVPYDQRKLSGTYVKPWKDK